MFVFSQINDQKSEDRGFEKAKKAYDEAQMAPDGTYPDLPPKP